MKKMFVSACLFAMIAFTACTEEMVNVDNEGNSIESVNLKEGEGMLSVAVSSTDVSTRDSRPLGSSAADNNVNVVKIYAFSSDAEAGSYTFDDKVAAKSGQNNVVGSAGVVTITNMSSSQGEHASDNYAGHSDQKKEIVLTGLVSTKYYKFVAVGFNDEDGTVNAYGEPELTSGVTSLTSFTTSNSLTDYAVEELFAAQSSEGKNGSTKDLGSITLTRQVAGMLAYFKNVPSQIDGKTVAAVRVYSNASCSNFTYPATTDFNGVSPTESKTLLMEFILDGEGKISTSTDENGYYTFNTMTKGQAGGDGTAPLAKNYTAPSDLTLAENSIFGGRYVIPYDKHYDAQTLTVELQDAEGNALRTLNVVTDNVPESGTKNQYDIRCNNFYSIGKKYQTDTTEDPSNPDTPIDLSNKSDITVIINDAWKVLHNMGVEDAE